MSTRLRIALVAAIVAALALPASMLAGANRTPSAGTVTPQIASDSEISYDNFESDMGTWSPTVGGQGQVSIAAGKGHGGGNALFLSVPNYTTNSIAYVKQTLATPVYALSANGWFNVTSGGCDNSAGYSAGNVPFFRFFDSTGQRVVGLYRINGSCSKTAKLYVQHSGGFFRTGKNIGFNEWNQLELRITVAAQGQSLVQVYVNSVLAYQTTTANNGIEAIKSVNIGNEHTNQVGVFYADKVRIATFGQGGPPPNPCNESTATPTTSDPGSVVVADNFESNTLANWSTTQLAGDGSAVVQSSVVKTGNCAALLHVSGDSGSRANLSKTLPAGTAEVWADGWFNVQAEGASNSNVPFFRLFNGSTRLVDVYRVNVSGQLYLRLPNGSGGWQYTSLNRTRALNTWIRVKVHAVAAGSASTVEIWVDDFKVLTRAGDVPLGATSFSSLLIHAEHFAQRGDLAVDDVVVKRVP